MAVPPAVARLSPSATLLINGIALLVATTALPNATAVATLLICGAVVLVTMATGKPPTTR